MKASKNKPAIPISDLGYTYREREILKHINLTVEPGEVFGYLGHNDAGKTTVMNIMTLLLTPTNGSVKIFGDSVNNSFAARQRIGLAQVIVHTPKILFLDEPTSKNRFRHGGRVRRHRAAISSNNHVSLCPNSYQFTGGRR